MRLNWLPTTVYMGDRMCIVFVCVWSRVCILHVLSVSNQKCIKFNYPSSPPPFPKPINPPPPPTPFLRTSLYSVYIYIHLNRPHISQYVYIRGAAECVSVRPSVHFGGGQGGWGLKRKCAACSFATREELSMGLTNKIHIWGHIEWVGHAMIRLCVKSKVRTNSEYKVSKQRIFYCNFRNFKVWIVLIISIRCRPL